MLQKLCETSFYIDKTWAELPNLSVDNNKLVNCFSKCLLMKIDNIL